MKEKWIEAYLNSIEFKELCVSIGQSDIYEGNKYLFVRSLIRTIILYGIFVVDRNEMTFQYIENVHQFVESIKNVYCFRYGNDFDDSKYEILEHEKLTQIICEKLNIDSFTSDKNLFLNFVLKERYLFHGTNTCFESSIQEHGLSNKIRTYSCLEVEKFAQLESKLRGILYQRTSESIFPKLKVFPYVPSTMNILFLTRNLKNAINYAYSAPEWFSMIGNADAYGRFQKDKYIEAMKQNLNDESYDEAFRSSVETFVYKYLDMFMENKEALLVMIPDCKKPEKWETEYFFSDGVETISRDSMIDRQLSEYNVYYNQRGRNLSEVNLSEENLKQDISIIHIPSAKRIHQFLNEGMRKENKKLIR